MPFTVDDLLQAQTLFTSLYMAQPVLSSLLYFVLFVMLSACCLPGAGLLMIAAGACMGLYWGTVLSTLASATGALLTMQAARYWFRERVARRFAAPMQTLEKGLSRHEINYLLSLRIAPVIPYVVLNLLAGLTHLRRRTFFWTSFVGMLPGTALYVNAGVHLSTVRSIDQLFSPTVIMSLLALALLPWLMERLLYNSDHQSH